MMFIDLCVCFPQEVEKRKRLADAYKVVVAERSKPVVLGGPDYEVRGHHRGLH